MFCLLVGAIRDALMTISKITQSINVWFYVKLTVDISNKDHLRKRKAIVSQLKWPLSSNHDGECVYSGRSHQSLGIVWLDLMKEMGEQPCQHIGLLVQYDNIWRLLCCKHKLPGCDRTGNTSG